MVAVYVLVRELGGLSFLVYPLPSIQMALSSATGIIKTKRKPIDQYELMGPEVTIQRTTKPSIKNEQS